jgi:hypothetical protein
MIDKNSQLIESLQHCITACKYCASSCLEEENVQSITKCIKTDLDCANICSITLDLLIGNSVNAVKAIELCKDICADCAAECEKHDHDHCQRCADACRRCEEHCRNFLSQ